MAYAQRYLERRRGFLARATQGNYEHAATGLGKPVSHRVPIGLRHMGTLKRADVEQWVTDSVTAGIGAVTINYRLAFLRMLYKDLLAEGEAPIQRDPTAGIRRLPVDTDVDRVLTDAEEEALLRTAEPEVAAAILAGLDAGLRWQEVYGLRACSVIGDQLAVTHVIEKPGVLRAFPKGRRSRFVPMTPRLAAVLEPLVAAAPNGDALLFPAPGGGPWAYDNHRKRIWLPTLHRVGLAQRTERPTGRLRQYDTETGRSGEPVMQVRYTDAAFGFHALRHTYGSRLAAKSVARSEIAKLMGHAQEATTERYIHAGDDGRRLELVRAALGHRTMPTAELRAV